VTFFKLSHVKSGDWRNCSERRFVKGLSTAPNIDSDRLIGTRAYDGFVTEVLGHESGPQPTDFYK